MREKYNISRKNLVFSQWSGKKYAAFASLGRVVVIAHVSADICNASLKKNTSIAGFSKVCGYLQNMGDEISNNLQNLLDIGIDVWLNAIAFIKQKNHLLNIVAQSEIGTNNNYLLNKIHILNQLKYGFFILPEFDITIEPAKHIKFLLNG